MSMMIKTEEIRELDSKTLDFILVAGPCSAESEQQVLDCARSLSAMGVRNFRAGAWKPRTRPGNFEGWGEKALEWLRTVKSETGMNVMTEVANARHVESALKAGIDMFWIGARTTTSPFAVQEIADSLRGVNIPVMVKNPINTELELWIGAFERLYGAGLTRLAAIHRGFSVHDERLYRYSPQWQIPVELRRRIPGLTILSRLTEVFYKPAVVLTKTGNMATGSARSVSGFDVYKAIESCKDLLENFGGHTYAAGLSLRVENVEEFKRRFEEYVALHIEPDQTEATIDIDAELDFKDIIHVSAVRILNHGSALKPYSILGCTVQVTLAVNIFHHYAGTLDGHGVKHDFIAAAGCTSLYAGAGNEVSIGSKSVTVKYLIAAIDHTLVIDIYVLDKEPGTHTVVLQRKSLGFQSAAEFIKQCDGLIVRSVTV